MSAENSTPPPRRRSAFLRNMSIGGRLTMGFGLLVALTLIVVGFGYWGSIPATENINRTVDVRFPTALVSARAQVDLLRMLGAVRGYLALGESDFRDQYQQSRRNFEADLVELERLSPYLSAENRQRLDELQSAFAQWSLLPDALFELRDDQLAREPAYRKLATEGLQVGVPLLIATQDMIEMLARQEPSEANTALITDLAQFQSSFAAMVSGLRGYTTTRNRDFKVEYRGNLTVNRQAWERIEERQTDLLPALQAKLKDIAALRKQFLLLPDEIFKLLESDRWREDLYIFSNEALPLANKMERLLSEMAVDQQILLRKDLVTGRESLLQANWQSLLIGAMALIAGAALAYFFGRSIAGPVLRLTDVVKRIEAGNLKAQAAVESGDEIGVLAAAFNTMTGNLRNTLHQVRREKRRADDLLEVVIPIGVELTTQKDLNRLLEKILLEAKSFCRADAGILYLRQEDVLTPVIMRNNSLSLALGGTTGSAIDAEALALTAPAAQPDAAVQAALTGASVNIPNLGRIDQILPPTFNGREYTVHSLLSIPLKNNQGQALGVLELINAQDPQSKDPVPFDQNLQQMMESFSSLAAAALEAYLREQRLKQEIQRLRIEIDESKRKAEVEKIVESDAFLDIQAKAEAFRKRMRRSRKKKSESGAS